MVRLGFVTALLLTFTLPSSRTASAQGQAMAPIKVNLPPSPNFDIATAPIVYPTGEMSVYGLRKGMTKNLDKDVKVKAYLLQLYECPPEIRKCNEDATKKAKSEKKKAPKGGEPPLPAKQVVEPGGCRPCDQPHFFLADTPQVKIERALLVADYPIKDWKTGKPKPLVAKAGDQFVVTGTFSINSMTGFAASNGLIIHKKMEDMQGNIIAEGNAVLPPEAQMIQMEGQAPEAVGVAKDPTLYGGAPATKKPPK